MSINWRTKRKIQEEAIDAYKQEKKLEEYAPIKKTEVGDEEENPLPAEFVTYTDFNNLTGQLYDKMLDSMTVTTSEEVRFQIDTALTHLRAFNRLVVPLLHT